MVKIALQVWPLAPQLEEDHKAAELNGWEICPFTREPFTHKLSKFDPSCQLVRGDVHSVAKIYSESPHLLFYNQENFEQHTVIYRLQPFMLNGDAQFYTWKQLFDQSGWILDGNHLFIRPNEDLKKFSGQLFSTKDFNPEGLFTRFQREGSHLHEDDVVCLAKPKNIHAEYRFVVVYKQALFGARLQEYGRIARQFGVPEHIRAFANEVCAGWLPSRVCVMDIAETDNGPKIVEFNCWNASGFGGLTTERRADMFKAVILALYGDQS